MEALTVIAVIATLAIIAWIFYAINGYSVKTYGYVLFSTGNMAYALLPAILYFFAVLVSGGETASGEISNTQVLWVCGLCTQIGHVWYLTKATDFGIGLVGSIMLTICATVMMLTIVFLLAIFFGKKNEKKG